MVTVVQTYFSLHAIQQGGICSSLRYFIESTVHYVWRKLGEVETPTRLLLKTFSKAKFGKPKLTTINVMREISLLWMETTALSLK